MTDNKVNCISVHELKKCYDASSNLCLIDVREDHEWQEIHIPRAIHIPKDELVSKIAAIAKDLDHPIYLHCRGGVRSLHAANSLMALGYKQVYSIDGGIMAWEHAGYPVNSLG